MKTAEQYFRQRNGGKSAEEMIKDGELISPVYALILMKDYAGHVDSLEQIKADGVQCNYNLLEAILKDVSVITGISIYQLRSRSRRREIAEARQFYFKRARVLTSAGTELIGSVVGRDHATVMHGTKVVDNVREVKNKYKMLFEKNDVIDDITIQTMDMLIGRSPKVVNMTSPYESIRAETIRPYSGYRVHSM